MDSAVCGSTGSGTGFLVCELVLWSLVFMEGFLSQPRYRGRTLVLPQCDVPDFADSPWRPYPLRGEDGVYGKSGKAGGGKAGGTGIIM